MAFGIAPVRVLGMDWMLETVRVVVIIVQVATVTNWKEEFVMAVAIIILKRIFYSILQYLIQTLMKEILHPS